MHFLQCHKSTLWRNVITSFGCFGYFCDFCSRCISDVHCALLFVAYVATVLFFFLQTSLNKQILHWQRQCHHKHSLVCIIIIMAYQVTAKCSQTISGLTRSRKKKMELFPASHHNLSHPVIIICFRTFTKPHVIQWNSNAIASDPFYSPIQEWNGSVCVFNVITFCFFNRFC